MIDGDFARLRGYRNNIHRYRRLLDTQLSELERAFVLKRMGEEQDAFQKLSSVTLPLVLTVRDTAP